MEIPSKEQCIEILRRNNTPEHIIEHCKIVCKVAEDVADKLINRGMKINKELVIAASLLHDIERIKDNHVTEGAKLLKSMGFLEISEAIRKHSLYKLDEKEIRPETTEEKIVFYADKRVVDDRITSLEERFEDLTKRYKKNFTKELEFSKKIEEELGL